MLRKILKAIDETTTTLSTVPKELPTSTTTTVQECIRSNSSINFERVRNVQLFLNKYGFNAGDVDGYRKSDNSSYSRLSTLCWSYPDGDIGPLTREAMKNWTGCETEATQVISTTTTVIVDNDSSDTSTTTTTTTIQENVKHASLQNKYGYTPSVSLLNNNVLSVFKSINNSDSICGTFFILSKLAIRSSECSNGKLEISSILNSPFIESEASTYIDLISSSDIKIIVDRMEIKIQILFYIALYFQHYPVGQAA